MNLDFVQVWRANVLGNRIGLVLLEAAGTLAGFRAIARQMVQSDLAPDGVALCDARASGRFVQFMNPDGSDERLCGNAAIAFGALMGATATGRIALDLGLGPETAASLSIEDEMVTLALKTAGTCAVGRVSTDFGDGVLIDVGTPHAVVAVRDPRAIPVEAGLHASQLLGVNLTLFQQINAATITVRTFERGVKHETTACGTGALAVGLAAKATFGTSNMVLRDVIYPGGMYRFQCWGEQGLVLAAISVPRQRIALQEQRLQVLEPSQAKVASLYPTHRG